MANTQYKIHFLTGTNAENMPALSINTIGNVYFLMDVINNTGKIVYDHQEGNELLRTVMSTEGIED